ncbi:MAG: KOW motif-containing protein [Polyangiaceae bacterium]
MSEDIPRPDEGTVPSTVLSLAAEDFDDPSDALQARLARFGNAVHARLLDEGFTAQMTLPRAGSLRFTPPGSDLETMALGIDVNAFGIDVALRVPTVPTTGRDYRNVCARMLDAEGALVLGGALESLPDPFACGPAGEVRRIRAPLRTDTIRDMLERAGATGVPFWVGVFLSRQAVLENVHSIDEELEDAIAALTTVARLITWSEENDFIRLRPARDRSRGQLTESWSKPNEAPASGGSDSRSTGSKDRDDRLSTKQLRESIENEFDDDDGDLEPSVRPPPVTDAPPLLKRNAIVFPRRGVLRRNAQRIEVDAAATVERGSRVRVLSGPFRDRVGVVSDLDPRGRARVVLGLFSTVCDTKDLIVAREGARPMLVSHRKPPGRS